LLLLLGFDLLFFFLAIINVVNYNGFDLKFYDLVFDLRIEYEINQF